MAPSEPVAGDRLALYGSLMRGLGGCEAAGIATPGRLEYEGDCVVEGLLYDLGAYPGLRPGHGRVHAECYRVLEPDVFILLDEFEGYDPSEPDTSLYRRVRTQLVDAPDREAWLYVYNAEPSPETALAKGDWRAYLKGR